VADDAVPPADPWRRLREHGVFFVIAACAATAVAAWAVSEAVRVKPVSADLERAELRIKALEAREAARLPGVVDPAAPVITDVVLTKIRNEAIGGHDIEQNIAYRDPEGDARFMSFVILGSDAASLDLRANNLRDPPERQVAGAQVKRNWACNRTGYSVKLRVYVTDAAGHLSRPRDFTLNC
jgi:hypothetical protein